MTERRHFQLPSRPRNPGRMRPLTREMSEAIARHSAAGRVFEAGGAIGFVREQGRGADVVCLHGVPTSSFLYRKVLPVLADQGLRGVAFDFPGLGLSERPVDFDYTWSGLSRWMGHALDALEIDRFHLVVHDIGGPIGFDWAARNPDRILSITVLNTIAKGRGFRRPWPMRPFAWPVAGELWLRATPRPLFSKIFYAQGIADPSLVSKAHVYAHHALLRMRDGGAAFLKIMRGFELGAERDRDLKQRLAEHRYPVRIVWGEDDPALGLDQMRECQDLFGLSDAILLPAKHYLQEDHAADIGQAIADLAAPLG
jgi:haloalkane dehalogenase